MVFTDKERAEILIHALPYIQKYAGKIVVVKYGGNAMINEELKNSVMQDCVLLNTIGIKVVLVHGGGPEISEMLKKTNQESVFLDGLRVTDKDTMDVVQMVLAGKINKNLVKIIHKQGGHAVGLSGIDGDMIKARMKDSVYGYVGDITEVNPKIIYDCLNQGYIPIISTIGYDDSGNSYNINADTAAAYVAGALQAEAFLSMTDIKGLLRDKNDESTLIRTVYVSDIKSLIKDGIIAGGMIPKIACCQEAIRQGVKKVFIIDGREPHSLLIEMLTDEGIGTMFK